MRLIIIKNKGIKKSKKNLQNTSLDDKMSTWSPAVLNDTAVKSRGGEFDEKAVKASIEKFKGVIENGGGTVEIVDEWGKRKLAYEIAKVNEGYYTLVNFTAPAELPSELDRIFRITDGVIRHIIVKEEA